MKTSNKIKLLVISVTAIILLLKLVLPTVENNKSASKHFWSKKVHNQQKYDVVFAGDSRVFRGVSPKIVFEKSTQKLSGINLGFSAAGYNKEYYDFITSKLNTESVKKIIVLGISPNMFLKESLENNHLASIQNEPYSQVFFNLFVINWLSFFEANSPSYILKKMLHLNRDNKLSQNYQNDGFINSDYFNPMPEDALAVYVKRFKEDSAKESDINLLIKQIASWEKEGINIIAFRPPSTMQMEKLEDRISGLDYDYLQEKIIENEGEWLNFNSSDYESYDGSHLRSASAIQFSKDFGIKLRKLINKPN
jgi:hypothetical protein